MTNKIFARTTKLVSVFLCLSGLLYHASHLLDDYLRGKSVVLLNVGHIQMDTLPTFTICTKNILAMDKVYQYNKRFIFQYIDYLKLYKELIELPNDAGSNDNQTYLVAKIENIFDNITRSIDFLHITGIEVHDNLTVQFGKGYGDDKPNALFDVYIVGLMSINGTLVEINSANDRNAMELQKDFHIKSLKVSYIGGYGTHKCFTTFSHLNPFWRKFKFKLENMEIHLYPTIIG